MSEKAMELINIQMVISIKETGIRICKMEEVPTIIQTEIFTKESGLMEDSMEMETTYILPSEASIKVIGNRVRSKVSDN